MQTVYVGNTLINDVMLGSQRMDDVISPKYDNDAYNFLIATNLTGNLTVGRAINSLVTSLKKEGIWTKLYALYPFVGGTSDTNKYNLINTGSYTLAFNGGWTYNSNGVSSNGTNAYANTSFIPTSSVSDYTINSSFSAYVRTNTTSSGYDMGSEGQSPIGTDVRTYFISKNPSNKATYDVAENPLTTTLDVNGTGFWIATISGSSTNNQRIFRNGTSVASKTNNIARFLAPPVAIYLGANNFQGTTANAFTSESYSLASIGKGFTDSEASTYNTVVQAFQTSLGRQV